MSSPSRGGTAQIDPRGPQFTAAVTSLVLVVVLLTAPDAVGVSLLGLQAALFALGAALGVQQTPTAYAFRAAVRPRLAPPTHLEDSRPPRFAQGVGFVFAAVGLVGYLAGPTWLGIAATALALVAAVLNATLRFCLGCQLYGVCKLPTDATTKTNTNTDNKKEALV